MDTKHNKELPVHHSREFTNLATTKAYVRRIKRRLPAWQIVVERRSIDVTPIYVVRVTEPEVKAHQPQGPKFPHVQVKLVGYDGNAFTVLGRVSKEMRRHGIGDADVNAFMTEAMSGDYQHLLATAMHWVSVS
jgi:hypothetical protein